MNVQRPFHCFFFPIIYTLAANRTFITFSNFFQPSNRGEDTFCKINVFKPFSCPISKRLREKNLKINLLFQLDVESSNALETRIYYSFRYNDVRSINSNSISIIRRRSHRMIQRWE